MSTKLTVLRADRKGPNRPTGQYRRPENPQRDNQELIIPTPFQTNCVYEEDEEEEENPDSEINYVGGIRQEVFITQEDCLTSPANFYILVEVDEDPPANKYNLRSKGIFPKQTTGPSPKKKIGFSQAAKNPKGKQKAEVTILKRPQPQTHGVAQAPYSKVSRLK